MIKNILGFNKHTPLDFLNELLGASFNEAKITKIYNAGIDLEWINEKGENFLHRCASENKPSSIQWLLKQGIDVEMKTDDGLSALFYAVRSGSYEASELLISKKANVKLLQENQRSLLQDAVKQGHKNIIRLLLNHAVDMNNVDDQGHNILFDAIENGEKELIALVAKQPSLNVNQLDNHDNCVLFHENVLKDPELALLLVENGVDLNATNEKKENYLFYCLHHKRLTQPILEEAIELGFDVNTKSNGKTMFMSICHRISEIALAEVEERKVYIDMLESLILKGANVDEVDENGENALFEAVLNNDIETAKLILSKKIININHKNKDGNTVLVLACLKGDKFIDMVMFLLSFSANPNIADNEGHTLVEKLINVILFLKNGKKLSPFFLKQIDREGDYFALFKKILENSKIFLRKLNSQGKPLFFDTVFHHNDMLFKLLKNYGADINHKDKDGKNILHNLLTMSNTSVFKDQKRFSKLLRELIFHGADVNSKDEEGSTSVHNAILQSNENTLKVLLDSKANMKAVDKKGRSLIHNCVWDAKVKHFRLVHSYNEKILNMPDKYGILPINYAAFIGHTDLVLEMITARSHVNNPHKKDQTMVDFFKKFYQNVYDLDKKVTDEYERNNIKLLITNMRTEFGLQDP